jgi:hypothetical protein
VGNFVAEGSCAAAKLRRVLGLTGEAFSDLIILRKRRWGTTGGFLAVRCNG